MQYEQRPQRLPLRRASQRGRAGKVQSNTFSPMSVSLEKRFCPICGDQADRSVPAVSSRPPGESLSLDELKPYWNRTLKKRVYLSYGRCQRCQLLYCPNYFSPAQLNELYAGMADNTGGISADILRKTQRGYFNVLKEFSPLHGDYLEVGPDIGLFVKNCVREGDFRKYWLFEPNLGVQEALRSVVRENEFEIIPSLLNVDLLPDGQIAVVAMVHVFDHLLDPVGTLKSLRKKLTSSAVILIVSPNESSFLARVYGRNWGMYSLEHPQVFNPTSITNLMKAAGFKVLTVRKSYNYFPSSYLFQRMMNFDTIRHPPVDLTLRIKLGNMITVASPVD
jgi:methyltransferase family protein